MWTKQTGSAVVASGNIDVKFPCPDCHRIVREKNIKIPDWNLMSDNAEESENEIEVETACTHCPKDDLKIKVRNQSGGFVIEVEGVAETDISYNLK
jgi:hypothetical protein